MKIGVLAMQGAVAEHIRMIENSGSTGIIVKRKEQLEELETREKAISELAGMQRMLWSKKLNELALLVPENVKFTHIFVEFKDGKNLLKLEGVSYSRSGEERVEQVSKLMKALKNESFYNKPSGEPNFGEIEFIQIQRQDDLEKETGLIIGQFMVQMEII